MVDIVQAETAKLETKYCIPLWLRDLQIKMSCERFKNRLPRGFQEKKSEPVAIVCFGTSLNQTWEEVKKFKYVISCSGSHKFLRERGITPTWHVEVDPRAHKALLIGDDISPDTEFLMASCCCPHVFTHLEKHNAKITLWHTYSGESGDEIPTVYPRNELIVTGGANVGLRAFVLARILGFTEFHVFGMDGSFPADGELKHAAFHPSVAKGHIVAKYNGKDYATTTAFLECARLTFHEIENLPDVSVKFYGEGLVQAMAKDKKLVRNKSVGIAFYSSKTISDEYREQNTLLHRLDSVYGIRAMEYKDVILKAYNDSKCRSLLDYGCGKGLLAKSLDFPIWEYDPCIPEKSTPPRAADMVACIDVLEHVELECLDEVLKDVRRCMKQVGIFVIGTNKSLRTLPNGENCHRIQEGKEWWEERIGKYFTIGVTHVLHKGKELLMAVAPKKIEIKKNSLVVTQEGALV